VSSATKAASAEQTVHSPLSASWVVGEGRGRADERGTRARLFITFWVVLTLHFATNIVREHYPAMALADSATLRVDPYLGLHTDLFVAASGGAYINNNPGASLLGAVPLLLFRPLLDWAESYGKRKVEESGGNVCAVYQDDRPRRIRFYREVRQRGLDLKFGLVAFLTVAFCMAPLTASAGVMMFDALRGRGLRRKEALFFALLFVFGTPLFFRTAYLNQNLALGLLLFFAFAMLWRDPLRLDSQPRRRLALAGFLAGASVLMDYSGVVGLLFLVSYALLRSRERTDLKGLRGRRRRVELARDLGSFVAGAAPPLLFLLAYQWMAFGHPLRLAQTVMPPTRYSVVGQSGMTWPQLDLVWANLFDPRFGLFAFGPLLLLAFPGIRRTAGRWLTRGEIALILGFCGAFLLFCSANQFARLQWNTGVRYLIPLVPFLFIFSVAFLRALPPWLCWSIAILAWAHAWCLAMVRESVPQSLLRVLIEGFQLPWLTVLGKMATQYAPFLSGRPSPLPLFALTAAFLIVLWRFGPGSSPSGKEPAS
jgi:hypothetical protein